MATDAGRQIWHVYSCHVFSDGKLIEAGLTSYFYVQILSLATFNGYLCLQYMLEIKKLTSVSNHVLQIVFSIFIIYISLLFLIIAHSVEDINTQKK